MLTASAGINEEPEVELHLSLDKDTTVDNSSTHHVADQRCSVIYICFSLFVLQDITSTITSCS